MIQRFLFLLSLAIPTALLAQPPANDLCGSVTSEPLAIGSTITFTGNRMGATSTNDGVAGSALVTTFGTASVWHAFTTTTCSDVTALYCNTPLPAEAAWSFITQDCPGDVPVYFSYANFGILCANGQFGIQWVNLPAGTYYMPISGTSSSDAYEITVSAVACTPGPANDDCSGATVLPVNTACTPVAGTVEHGTQSIAANDCNGFTGDANDDVWFSFVATGTSHTITFQGNGDLDAILELFAGDCGNMAPIGCSDVSQTGGTETIDATGLTVGTSYKVRAFHYYTALASDPTFTICVTGDLATALAEHDNASMQVLPNPAQDKITIQRTGAGQVRILDLTGRVMWSDVFVERTVVDVRAWPRGSYLVQVVGAKGTSSERIILD